MRTRRTRVPQRLWAALLSAGAAACGGTPDTTLPLDVQLGFGSIDVTVNTTGADLDPDGYILVIDEDRSQAVDVNGSVEFTSLVPGQYEISLTDYAANCVVAPPNPQSVTVIKDVISEAAFLVTCAP